MEARLHPFRSDLTLAAAQRVMAPMVGMLLREGVTYPRLAHALKQTFLDAAPAVLAASSTPISDSSISTLTGVHRKDVREWRTVGRPLPQANTFGAVMKVFTRWASDPEYCDKTGCPRALERSGGAGSFEALATATSKDVHPQTLLQELIRLGVATLECGDASGRGERVSLRVDALVPTAGIAEILQLLADNVGDHLSAAAHNLTPGAEPMLEQSVFADDLRPESANAMGRLARGIWSKVFHDIVREATALSNEDFEQADADQRIRIGMYFYRSPNLKR